ncbi:MAG: hypothetical protein A2Z88_11330 [Omnitrophica WOR_2 bacterium GWA2_47_8]|nr:MAG: hypothetical protein A2Z88_11330 [Omnitrophica WOR_2 bacterium GWA2_47_8]
MKIEYLKDGSPDCPILRLFEFNNDEVARLKEGLEKLRDGKTRRFEFHRESYVAPVNNCQLTFEIGDLNKGVYQAEDSKFVCGLKRSGYAAILGFLEPFCVKPAAKDVYQWLDETGEIALLLSRKGNW